MSCSGQSDAAHSTITPTTNQRRWRRVTTGDPSRTTFGPMTRVAYSPRPTTAAISTHTSGCGENAHGWSSASAMAALLGEDVEGRESDHVDGRREDDPS